MKRLLITSSAMGVVKLSTVAVHGSVAFVAPSVSRAKIFTPIRTPPQGRSQADSPRQNLRPPKPTAISMGYQLPPSGPKGPLEQIQAILPTIGTALLVALFFASPLGGLFFALFNSIFVLALLTPLILYGGFQIWSALYTIEAPCPSCGVIPIRVLKNGGEPSICINCGSLSRANANGDGLELCNNPNDMIGGLGGGSLFDSLFGMGGNGMSDYDVFDDIGSKRESSEEQAKKAKRQATVIDVDVERE
jgi:hypothetical protein